MDDFYLPEEIVEWLARKKSEFLSELISNSDPDDFGFEEYSAFESYIPQTLSVPDLAFQYEEDKILVKTFIRSFSTPEFFQQIIIGALIPDQNTNDVFVPILSFVTRKQNLIKLFSKGEITVRPMLN